jgi:predicted TIM-barrel fold metal-dependent hydrolase
MILTKRNFHNKTNQRFYRCTSSKKIATVAIFLAVVWFLSGINETAIASDIAKKDTTMRKIIDIQSHFLPKKWLAELSKRTEFPFLEKRNENIWVLHGSPFEKLPYQVSKSGIDIQHKLKEMDEAGIEIGLLSLSLPGPDNGSAEADKLAKIANDGIAEIVSKYPTRFRGIANLGYGNIDESVKELRRCIDTLGFVGLQVFPFVGGKMSVVDSSMKPIWRILEEKNIPLILHPGSPANADYGNYFIGGLMGYWFDDAMVMVKFILSGTLDEFPNLKIVCPHTWSLLPYLIDRLDYQVPRFASQFPEIKLKKKPSEYLKNIYTDCNNFSSDDLQYAIKKMGGVNNMMFGSDSPFIPTSFIVDVAEKAGLTPDEIKKVFSGNAKRLFKINP